MIDKIEDKWLQKLYEKNKYLFQHKALSSHDQDHHLRVWAFAKEILSEIQSDGKTISPQEIEQILFAVFFHDTGMNQSLQRDHGKYSREACEAFNREHQAGVLPETLDAIEYHDDKDRALAENACADSSFIFPVLSAADDLDAFGAIGVFRYIEIYLLRGMKSEKIAPGVLNNLEKRFQLLQKQFGKYQGFMERHGKRFEYTRDFFTAVKPTDFCNPANYDNQAGVINFIRDFVVGSVRSMQQMVKMAERVPGNNVYHDFFKQLAEEARN